MFHFYTSWKHQKTGVFLVFSGGIEVNIGWKQVVIDLNIQIQWFSYSIK